MYIFNTVSVLQAFLERLRKNNHSIGFAPTMGALHDGHLSLIRLAKAENDYSIASIFVNPTQFNDPKDLEKYPRTEKQDAEMLVSAGNDMLFLPAVSEIYPPNKDLRNPYQFGQLATVMEGAFRPGHFDGMAQVVKRLLDIVQPDKLYMGQKDFQQFSIVANMLQQMQSKTKLVMCPILREADGLAMSSRNVRLTPEIRQQAPIIYATLQWAKQQVNHLNPAQISALALEKLAAIPGFKPEYFEIVDGRTLQNVTSFADSDFIVACVATWAGDVRLIDNEILKN